MHHVGIPAVSWKQALAKGNQDRSSFASSLALLDLRAPRHKQTTIAAGSDLAE